MRTQDYQRMRRSTAIRSLTAAAAAGAVLPPRFAFAQTPTTVNIGVLMSVSDGPLLVADERGYFRDVGIVPAFHTFASAALTVASLGTGQLDVSGGAPSAGLYNAVGRGIPLKIVCDRGTAKPGYGFSPLMVRTELMTSGKVKSIADLKGLKIAEPAKGTTVLCQIVKALATANLTYDDVEHEFLGFPAQVTALQNGSIDATIALEPFATLAQQRGVARVLERNDVFYPNEQITLFMYSPQFASGKGDVAKRFMVAYLRGQRAVIDAVRNAHLTGPGSDDIIAIMNKRLHIAPDVLRAMTVASLDPNGNVNRQSLKEDHDIYKKQGLITGNATVDEIVDMSFVEAAAKQLGPYKPGH